MSRTENSLRNIKFALFFQAASILVAFLTRKVFVLVLTQEYLGLDGTFSNILTMLSLAELGIGGAITYSLYKPLAQDDRAQITALMALFRRVYWSIGGIVALLGCALAPLLPVLIRDMPDLPHIYLIYMLFVLNTALSYFGVYKQSLIIADQRQYITSTCHYGLKMLLFLAQALFLWLTHNYFVYLGLMLGATLAENLILTYQANRLYPYLKKATPAPLPQETRKDILRNTKALLTHRVGGIVVFGTDNLLISKFVGLATTGLYSNYMMIRGVLNVAVGALSNAVMPALGSLAATTGLEEKRTAFCRLDFCAAWLIGWMSVCLWCLYDPFIDLWLGRGYRLPPATVLLIVVNFYLAGMRVPVASTKSVMGLFWDERYKSILEALVNLTVSIALARRWGIAGILAGTLISTVSMPFWIEPLGLYRHGLEQSPGGYFARYFLRLAVTAAAGGLTKLLCAPTGEGVGGFAAKALLCAAAPNLVFLAAYRRAPELAFVKELLFRRGGGGGGKAG